MKARGFIALGLMFGLSLSTVMANEPIRLESQFVGDKEQPAVSYFVPWQGPDGGGDKLHQKVEEKYDHSLNAIDRDVMLRSMRIYNEMNLENVDR